MIDDLCDFLADFGALIIAALFLLIVVGFAGFTIAEYHHDVWHHGCRVNNKDRTSNGSSSSMRIYTDNCGVLGVSDAMWIGHFNSADTYNSIEVGKTYDFETLGFRIPFLSDFPNIITVSPQQ